jgi:C4-dicarboxylate transporter
MKNLDFKKIGIVVAVLIGIAVIGFFVKKHLDKKKLEAGNKTTNTTKAANGSTTQTGTGHSSIMADSPFVGGQAIEFQSAN